MSVTPVTTSCSSTTLSTSCGSPERPRRAAKPTKNGADNRRRHGALTRSDRPSSDYRCGLVMRRSADTVANAVKQRRTATDQPESTAAMTFAAANIRPLTDPSAWPRPWPACTNSSAPTTVPAPTLAAPGPPLRPVGVGADVAVGAAAATARPVARRTRRRRCSASTAALTCGKSRTASGTGWCCPPWRPCCPARRWCWWPGTRPGPVLAEIDNRFGAQVQTQWLQSGPEVWQVRLERVAAPA
jgi:hypothetical protein